MDYVKNSIDSIRDLQIWANFNEQFLPSVIEHKRRNDSQFSNLLEQLWATENVLCHISSPTLEAHKPLLRELDCVVGRAITLVKEVCLNAKDSSGRRGKYSGEHYLEVFLDLRWWTWVMIYKVDDKFLRTACYGERYLVTPKGVLDPASSRLPSFMQKLYLWWSRSDGNVRHLPSYGIEVFLQGTEGLSSLLVWLKTERGNLLDKFDITEEIRSASAESFIVEGKALVLSARKLPWVGDELKIDLTQAILGVSHSGLVIKCQGSGTEYALKRVNNLDQEQPVIARLFHPHIVLLVDYWRENGFLFLAMEWMEGDLKELITRRLREKRTPFMMNVVIDIMLQIAKAMLYIHDMDLTHPHLKSSDVLFKDATDRSKLDKNEINYLVKLGDFRFYAKNDFESMARRNVYQFGLICLEVLSKEPLHWEFEERIPGMSEEPILRFNKIRNDHGSAIPESLTQCIRRCLDGSIKFSEVVVMLLLVQLQVLTRATKESSTGYSDSEHTLLAKHQDLPSSPGSSSKFITIPEDLEDMKLIPVEDDFGASGVPVYLSSTDFEEGEYMESVPAALELCGKQVQEFVNLLPSVNIFRFLSTHLVETLSPSAEMNLERYRGILGLLFNVDIEIVRNSSSLRNSISFCFEALVGLARQFQLVIDLLRKCNNSDWCKSALELADMLPSKHMWRWSEFSLFIQTCEFSLDLVELAFHALEKLLIEDQYTARDATFKWSEGKCRMVLQIGAKLERENITLEESLLETCRDLEDKDLNALTEKLGKLIESERTKKPSVKGLSNALGIANYLNEKLKGSIGTYILPTFTKIEPSSLKYLEFLDMGSSGMVAIHEWYGMKVAVKSIRGMDGILKKSGIMSKNKTTSKNKITSRAGFEQEVAILAMVQHPNVVRLIGCGFIEESNTGLLVMELMDHDLRTIIDSRLKVLPKGSSPFSLSVAMDLMLQIAQAMRYLREHNILHRDLKATNILVNICKPLKTSYLMGSDPANTSLMEFPVSAVLPHTQETYRAKLADFGLAKPQLQKSHVNTLMVGTAGWRAPEIFRVEGLEVAQTYRWSADVYSYAMTCYEILTGKVPFENEPNHMLYNKIVAGERPSLDNLIDIPETLKKLLEKCWATDPKERPPFEDIVKKLWECKVLVTLSNIDRQIVQTSGAPRVISSLSDGLVLEPKHSIFLSHSGRDKEFVEHLCEDLERHDRYPFLDRHFLNLYKGEKFSDVIRKAAQQCQVAVVVVSDDYFMSKWCMIELHTFVQASREKNSRLKIIPLFYRLSGSEFYDETRQKRWFNQWATVHAQGQIKTDEWKHALQVLRSINGISYDGQPGIVAFRNEVVSCICNLVPPDIKWDDSHVQGKARISKIILDKIDKIGYSTTHNVSMLGLYGMGGIGKTTICKVLCHELLSEFEGKVCHLELGSKSSQELLWRVLLDLTNTSPKLLQELDEIECVHLFHQRVSRQRTFLALDNVWDDFRSLEQARMYLRGPFHDESVVIVTARSQEILKGLGIHECFEMPELEQEEAMSLFLFNAGEEFAKDEDKRDIQLCIERCFFRKGYQLGYHYHPLALAVLGRQLRSVGEKPREWVEYLSNVDNFVSEMKHPVFDILRRNFDTLLLETQTLFMDVVIYTPNLDCSHLMESGDMEEWLCLVHLMNENEIQRQLHLLKRKGLLEDVDLASGSISIHDLYRSFALHEVNGDLSGATDMEYRRWVYVNTKYVLSGLELIPSGRCWEKLCRLGINLDRVRSLEGIQWEYYSNVVILKLDGSPWVRGVLNLEGLRCLRSLELLSLVNLDSLEGLEELENLTYFRWCHANGSFWNVKNEDVHTRVGRFPASLEVVQIEVGVLLEPHVLARCYNLRKLVLYDTRAAGNLHLSNSAPLQSVKLHQVRNFHTLDGLTASSRLQSLVVQGCKDLVHIELLHHLIGLELLVIEDCKFKEVPDLQYLTKLQVLRLAGEQLNFPCVPRQLRELSCRSMGPTQAPNLNGFDQLEVIDLSGEWTFLEGIGDLLALRCLNLSSCTISSRLPDLRESTSLEELNLVDCEIELHEEDIRTLASLPLLQPVPIGGQGSNYIRLDLVRRKVLRYLSKKDGPPDSWLAWKQHDWEESELGIPPIRIGRSV